MDETSGKNWLNQPHHPSTPVPSSQIPNFNEAPLPNFTSAPSHAHNNTAAQVPPFPNFMSVQTSGVGLTTTQSSYSQSTPLTPTPNFNANGWHLPDVYSQYNQWFAQQQQMMAGSSTFSQTPLSHRPNMPTMPHMSPFFPYTFPNSLQHSPSFSPIDSMGGSPMTGSPMTRSPLTGSPIVGPANMLDQQPRRETIIVERKRPRITYNQQQTAYLENWYNNKNHFITTVERNQIARDLNVDANQIRIWFQNKRARERQRRKDHIRTLNMTPVSMNGSLMSMNGGESSSYMTGGTPSSDSGIGMNMTNGLSSGVSPGNAIGQQLSLIPTSMFEMLHMNQQQQQAGLLTPSSSANGPEVKRSPPENAEE